jgi:hypothetical protein
MQHIFLSFLHIITACFSLTQPSSGVYTVAKLLLCHLSMAHVNALLFLILKCKEVHKIAHSVVRHLFVGCSFL